MKSLFKYYFIESEVSESKFGNLARTAMLGGLSTLGSLNMDASPSHPMQHNIQHNRQIHPNELTKLFRAIQKAETGSISNPWIRTRYQPKGGSTAFGPVQITKSLITTAIQNHSDFYKRHKDFIDKYIKQGDLFAKYGAEDMVPGYERYDYGREGDLTSPEDKREYMKMAYDLMNIILKESHYDLQTFIKNWRGVKRQADPRYYNIIESELSI